MNVCIVDVFILIIHHIAFLVHPTYFKHQRIVIIAVYICHASRIHGPERTEVVGPCPVGDAKLLVCPFRIDVLEQIRLFRLRGNVPSQEFHIYTLILISRFVCGLTGIIQCLIINSYIIRSDCHLCAYTHLCKYTLNIDIHRCFLCFCIRSFEKRLYVVYLHLLHSTTVATGRVNTAAHYEFIIIPVKTIIVNNFRQLTKRHACAVLFCQCLVCIKYSHDLVRNQITLFCVDNDRNIQQHLHVWHTVFFFCSGGRIIIIDISVALLYDIGCRTIRIVKIEISVGNIVFLSGAFFIIGLVAIVVNRVAYLCGTCAFVCRHHTHRKIEILSVSDTVGGRFSPDNVVAARARSHHAHCTKGSK